jgi:hypothetical protein
MTINSVNRPAGDHIIVMRQYWVLFIPFYLERGRIEGDNGLYEDLFGFIEVFNTDANAWFLETWVLKDGKETWLKSYWLRWELFNMPDKSTVTIDWATQEMKVVEGQ